MQRTPADEFAVECLWPGVDEDQLTALEARISACLTRTPSVRYGGLLLLREDEVVLCQFHGPLAAVRTLADDAAIPYERIIALTSSPGT